MEYDSGYQAPRPTVPWFDIDSIDQYNLRAHLEQTSAMESYIGEQFSLHQKAYEDAKDYAEQVFARAFVKARQHTIERISKKKTEHGNNMTEEINVNDDMAKYLAIADPEVIAANERRNEARYKRDVWRGYSSAMNTKVRLLCCLAGQNRDELNAARLLGVVQ